MNIIQNECLWIVNSGASFHVTPHKEVFSSYRSGDFSKVKMGNQGVSSIVGVGNINIMTETGCILSLKDVRLVPDIRLSLIFVGKLDDTGMTSQFDSGN